MAPPPRNIADSSSNQDNGGGGKRWKYFVTFMLIFLVLALAACTAFTILAYNKRVSNKTDLSSKSLVTGPITSASITNAGALTTGSFSAGPPTVTARTKERFDSLAASVYPLSVDGTTGQVTIKNVIVTGTLNCTGAGCPSNPQSLSAPTSFPITAGTATSTFSTGTTGAQLQLSSVVTPSTTGLTLTGATGVTVVVGTASVITATPTGTTVAGPVSVSGALTATGTVTAPIITLGTKNLTVSATAVCGNNILEGSEGCDNDADPLCLDTCQRQQTYPYWVEAPVVGDFNGPIFTTLATGAVQFGNSK